jgi:hypothetical protein
MCLAFLMRMFTSFVIFFFKLRFHIIPDIKVKK